jgi:hypothetical protein
MWVVLQSGSASLDKYPGHLARKKYETYERVLLKKAGNLIYYVVILMAMYFFCLVWTPKNSSKWPLEDDWLFVIQAVWFEASKAQFWLVDLRIVTASSLHQTTRDFGARAVRSNTPCLVARPRTPRPAVGGWGSLGWIGVKVGWFGPGDESKKKAVGKLNTFGAGVHQGCDLPEVGILWICGRAVIPQNFS